MKKLNKWLEIHLILELKMMSLSTLCMNLTLIHYMIKVLNYRRNYLKNNILMDLAKQSELFRKVNN